MKIASVKREQARRWLRTELSQGGRVTTEVRALALDAGITAKMLLIVKREMGIETQFVDFGVWHWLLPANDPTSATTTAEATT